MATRLYANLGRAGSDATPVTNTLLQSADDNALVVVGAGWAYALADRSPDGPADGFGYRRTPTGGAAYLRAEWVAASTRGGARMWVYVPGAPSAHVNVLRVVGPAEQNLANVFLRSNACFRAAHGSSTQAASDSPVLAAGWYAVELIIDSEETTIELRVQNAAGVTVHTWSGTGFTFAANPSGARFGEPQAGSHNVSPVRIGSRLVWGSIDTGWIGPRDPYEAPAEPPPATTPVSHYNTAETLTVDAVIPIGGGLHGEGVRMDGRFGSGTMRVTDTDPIFGTRSYRVQAGPDQSAHATWSISSSRCAVRAYLRLGAAPTVSTQVILLRNAIEEPVGRIFLSNAGTVGLQVEREGIVTTVQLSGGAVSYPDPIRLELRVDVTANLVEAAWGYRGGPRQGTAEITTRDLGGHDIMLAQFGKTHGNSWDADFLLDELAANARATAHIGAYAPTYDLLPTVGPDLTGIEPGSTFTLTAQGQGTWVQTTGPDAGLTGDGPTVTGTAPYTVDGAVLGFAYGPTPLNVSVLRATEFGIGPDGTLIPLALRAIGAGPP